MNALRLKRIRVKNVFGSKTLGKITPKSLITAELIFVLNIRWIIDYLQLPLVISRLVFVLPFMLIIWQFSRIVSYIKKTPFLLVFACMGLFGSLMGWIGYGLDPILIAWTFINHSLYVLFFVGCIVSMGIEDVIHLMEMLCKFNLLNIALCLHQYFVLGLYSDFLGGLFGILQGCNGYQNIYAVVVCGYLIYRYMQNGKILRIGFHLASFLIIAAASDLIGFFVEISICFIIMVLAMPEIGKKIKILTIIILVAVAGVSVFRLIYPVRFEYFLNSTNWLKYMGFGRESNGGIYGISRTNPFSQINERFFRDNIWYRLFGIGYGNASISEGVELFQSEFYLRNSSFPYQWFTTSYIYVEQGIFGLIGYLTLAVGFVLKSIKAMSIRGLRNVGVLGIIYSLCYIFIFFYNQSLINAAAYIMYTGISIPFIASKRNYFINPRRMLHD